VLEDFLAHHGEAGEVLADVLRGDRHGGTSSGNLDQIAEPAVGAPLGGEDGAFVRRGRRAARLTALTSGGTIPDTGDYSVLLEPQGLQVGTLNEDFAIESMAGDIFQLGNQSYRILRIEPGKVRVEDARGQSPTIPFWLGEAPGRTDELSAAVARLRGQIDLLLGGTDPIAAEAAPTAPMTPRRSGLDHEALPATSVNIDNATNWLMQSIGLEPSAAQQIVDYLARARAALGGLPTQRRLVMERFFDESGGMQLIIHSPFGSRLNRAWGLALRKRFCRSFNFELQAAATEDALILSLSTSHSFPAAGAPRPGTARARRTTFARCPGMGCSRASPGCSSATNR
jgi:ATP-dependent Lhr-like helicase